MTWVVLGSIGWLWLMVCLQSLHSVGVVSISITFVVILCPFLWSVCLMLLYNPFEFFSFGLLPVFFYLVWFCHIYFTYDITWFDVLLFLFLILLVVCVMGIMGYILGGSYSSVYVPPPVFVSPVVLVIYIPMTFFLFFPFHIMFGILISWYSFTPCFAFSHLCDFFPWLDENFWGVYAYVFHHMKLYVHFEICVLNIIYHIWCH